MQRLAIIANPTAGAAAGRPTPERTLLAAQHDLQRSGFAAELWQSTGPDEVADLAEKAARDGITHIVAAGGDGTVNCVVNGLMRTRGEVDFSSFALGVLPIGTGNVFAFNMGIPRTWREACRVIRAGHKRTIDVGLATHHDTSRHFLLMAGIGYDAKVIEETSLRLKYVLRDFAYALRTLQNVVLHQGTQITLRFPDGKIYANEAWLVMVGNAASYAWDIKVTAHAQLDDGLLDICLMPFENKIISVQQAMQVLMGLHIERGIAHYWKTPSLRIESEPDVPVQLDGDSWATTPIDIKILPATLNVFSPLVAEEL